MTDEEKARQYKLDLDISRSDYKLLEETHKELREDYRKLEAKHKRLKALAMAMAEEGEE